MTILVYAEHDNHELKKATLHTITAANKIGGEIHVLIAGNGCQAVADAAANIDSVNKVLLAEHEAYTHQLPENVASLIAKIGKGYSHIIAPATTTGKDILPRAAALLDVNMLSDITAVVDAKTFERPIYAGNAIATIQDNEPIVVLSVRTTAFDAANTSSSTANIERVADVINLQKTQFVNAELAASERPELTNAGIIVSGGRALGGSDGFHQYIEPLADKLKAAVGASRAAVDAGWVPNDLQVGQTGKIVAPDLYIAIGISGAIQHLAGMKDSKVIVAINTDPEAPIAGIADYFLEADLKNAVPELINKL